MPETRMPDAMLRGLVAAAALVVIVAGLSAASSLLVPMAIAGFIAITSYPLVAWLERHRLPTWSAVSLTLIALVLTLLGPGLVVQDAARRFLAVSPRCTISWSVQWNHSDRKG